MRTTDTTNRSSVRANEWFAHAGIPLEKEAVLRALETWIRRENEVPKCAFQHFL